LPSTVPIVDVIIPAYNEQESIALVVNELPKELVRDIIVCNNNSKDNTANVARNAGAVVVDESRAGYGSACLRGMAYIAARPKAEHPDIVVFIDGDHSDYPEQLPELVAPILNDGVEEVCNLSKYLETGWPLRSLSSFMVSRLRTWAHSGPFAMIN